MATVQLSIRLLIVIVLMSPALFGQGSQNIEYLGSLNTRADPVATNPPGYSGSWGYVAPDGREYALLGCVLGTQIVDITDAPTLREVAFIPGPRNGWREMKTYRDVLYIVSESFDAAAGAGVQIVDLSKLPLSASLINTFSWTDTLSSGVVVQRRNFHTITIAGRYLYLNGNQSGIRILDVTDPLTPRRSGFYDGPYIHDSFVRNDTIFGSAIQIGDGLDIIDARDKANLQRIKLVQYPGAGTHNAWTTYDGRYVLTTDEGGTSRHTLKMWDLADVQNPQLMSTVNIDTTTVHNVFVKGDLAYVAWYTAGLGVVDISNPAQMSIVGTYDTYPADNSPDFQGAWGAFPYYPSGKVIISDRQTGLHVMRYSGDRRGIVSGTVKDGLRNKPVQYAMIHFPELSLSAWSGADGKFLFGYAPGSYRAYVERPGFVSDTLQLEITEGQSTTLDLALAPLDSTFVPDETPSDFSLSQNYPNPFNSQTTIHFALAEDRDVVLEVFDVLGRKLGTLVDSRETAGTKQVVFDAQGLPTGVYYYWLRAGTYSELKRMVLLR